MTKGHYIFFDIKLRTISVLLTMALIQTSNALEIVFSSRAFKRLTHQESKHLKRYLTQIEDSKKHLFSAEQIESVVDHFDKGKIFRRNKSELEIARKEFTRKRIMIAADWCYYNKHKMPNLITSTATTSTQFDHEKNQTTHDLHHIVFLKLNGQNEWWNIVPISWELHHSVIHAKGQPGEELHKLLEERFPDQNIIKSSTNAR